ncbi:MAG: NAD(P)H-quinone oxidoreductase [Gemmatimonadota bacterium]
MHAIVIDRPGGPDVLRWTEAERPTPRAGEVLVQVVTAGVNRADLLQRRGLYPAPPDAPADIPGLEYAGRVHEVGPDVTRLQPGDAVLGILGGGGYAEYVRVHERTAMRLPDGADLRLAGAIPEAFLTAYDAVVLQAGLAAGECLLVHAVASGVGTAAVQLARWLGARSVGTSRTPEKLAHCRALGLDVGIVAESPDAWVDAVLEATDGRGADVILDLVGGAYLAGNQRALAERGRHVVVGVTAGAKAEIDLRALMGRRGEIRGTVLRARPLEEKIALARTFEARVLPAFAEGRLRPVVDRILPAAQAADAHRSMEENRNVGKILLEFGDGAG